ncbi:unnamed protein product [Paramecium pentaurelia]|uniref:Uncharacterized protein n=1 Tax=Paramecium pentaurelia TaxID=43138 RepID=A0A8S1SKE9_9CILI|nr:unnamed protein product [Paramecium pentaurelia]
MFTEQPYYEAKVFLKSYNDAISCLREAAEYRAHIEFQEHALQSLATARTRQELDVRDGQVVPGLNFAQSKQTKLFQFSNHVFSKYLKGFEEYAGNFKGFQQILNEGLKKMKSDVK